ncbi:bacillithiol biosynthesis cysteine-adding enzyme BshC [Rivularia sp. PCC 7116]|uniref:bacillithiol biosynthesis cysteine-adding enzyme BshC n=1 Tax=Rivularia sp. PCC 7116 TaxID=373994 RepID=UPI00029EF2E9|nr:bacillithiol biosynthesis cysteine-adding enzyme BshC [Rivularia sp. PCC 7116]AFY57234.1 bacillithiol biosynthesis cysteine-adding enzyme BshC [Rivularia sp. PCC 7116]
MSQTQTMLSGIATTPHERYEAWAESYDERTSSFNWSAPQYLLKAVLGHAIAKGNLRVLDIGVGTGQASVPYLEAGACVTGIDISQKMLEEAKAKNPQFHALIEHDFNIPLSQAGLLKESFDVVISCGALHFATDLQETLAQLRWVIANGGILAFTYIPPQERTFSKATQPHNPNHVERMLEQFEFQVLEHQPFLAYYDNGDSNDPVYYQLIVAGCTKQKQNLPESLVNIDRTACVDRSKLVSVVSQPLMKGISQTQWSDDLEEIQKQNQFLVNTLRSQVESGKIEPKKLPLTQVTAAFSRQRIPETDILVLMPHPDDESIYAGGTIAALTAAGYKVRLVVATDGKGGRGAVNQRISELDRAVEILGIERVETLGLDDFGKYRNSARTIPITAADTLCEWGLDKTASLIVHQIRKHRPRILLTLHPEVDPNYSLHGHHLGLGAVAVVGYHLAADPKYILPDSPNLLPWAVDEHQTIIPDISENSSDRDSRNKIRKIEIDKELKLKAILAHQTQGYSTQRLISFLKSDNPQNNFETIQILQRRCCSNLITAISLTSDRKPHPFPSPCQEEGYNHRNWNSIYNSIRQRNYPRHKLAELLKKQAETWGNSKEVKANIDKLLDSQTVAVVTGQQVGILGGPVYTLYKALGAIKLARVLSEQGIPAVPIFWMASYDHDIDEVQQVKILNKRPEAEILNLDLAKTNRSVGSTNLGLTIESLLDEIERLLANLPHSQEISKVLRNIYQPQTNFAKAFGRWLNYLTSEFGLIILDPNQPEFAQLAKNIITKELFHGEGTQLAFQRSRQILANTGQTEIIPTNRDVTQVFFTDNNGIRQRLIRVEGGFLLQQTNLFVTKATLKYLLEKQPERFTPSALLRPLYQDTVLPTIAYIAGPTEQKYFTQLPEVYKWATIPIPEVVARPSFTVIDSGTANILNQAGGTVNLLNSTDASSQIGIAGLPKNIRLAYQELNQLQQQSFELLEIAKENQPLGNKPLKLQQDIENWLATTAPIIQSWGTNRISKVFNHAQTELYSLIGTVTQDLESSGTPGNPPPLRNSSKLAKKLGNLQNNILREGRRQNTPGIVALANISPNNSPQERNLSIAELIAKHGKSIIPHLLRIAEIDSPKKLVIGNWA